MWAVFFLLILPVTAITVYRGFVVGEMELPGGFRITFKDAGGTAQPIEDELKNQSEQEKEQRQNQLEAELEELKRRLNKTTNSPQPSFRDLSGTWYGQGGITYKISQSGSQLTIEEISPYYGVTAVGNGHIRGNSVSFSYHTAAFTQGSSELTLSSDGNSLSGYFRDNNYGTTVPANLHR